MQTSVPKIIPLVLAVLIGCTGRNLQQPPTLDELRIDVHGASRLVSFTNKNGGYYLTETNTDPANPCGWYIERTRVLNDYAVEIDGRPLRKSDVHLAMVWPHRMQRAYPSGVQEAITLLDSVNALVVALENIKGQRLTLSLSMPLPPEASKRAGDAIFFQTSTGERWLGVAARNARLQEAENTDEPSASPRLTYTLDGSTMTLLFVSGPSQEETVRLIEELRTRYPDLMEQRKRRMTAALSRSFVRTDNADLNKALGWAILSLDGLVDLHGKRIFGGLPTNGHLQVRECLLSVPGALLVGGRFDEAKTVLRTVAAYQDQNPQSRMFGMIPSEVDGSHPLFAAADVTPLFVSSLYEYARHSNDTTLMKELYPVVRRSIEGALRFRVDRNLFLKHGGLETWEGSGRGDPASEVQALWVRQLQLGAVMAAFVGEQELADRWNEIANQVGERFNALFVSPGGDAVFDYLQPNGVGVRNLHPSLLFTFDVLDHPYKRMTLFRSVTERLVYERGIRSPDAGSRVWMNGIWIDLAAYFELPDVAFKVTGSLIREILDGRYAGTLPEVLPATRGDGMGAISHAPALAEFVRTFVQSYLGIYVDGSIPRLILKPQLPAGINRARVRVPVERFVVEMEYRAKGDRGEIEIAVPADGKNLELHVAWNLPHGVQRQFDVGVEKGSTVLFLITPEKVEKELNGVSIPVRSTALKMVEPEPLRLASEQEGR